MVSNNEKNGEIRCLLEVAGEGCPGLRLGLESLFWVPASAVIKAGNTFSCPLVAQNPCRDCAMV